MHSVIKSAHMEYRVVKTHAAKHLRITVRHDGSVRVSAPPRVSDALIAAFVASKAAWIADAQEKSASTRRKTVGTGTREEYLALQSKALALVRERLAYFNQFYGLTWHRISIRNQRSRWGSCSREGNLSFNYRIVLLPPELADYLVVHELCHLRYMSHGVRFWELVGRTVEGWEGKRRRLGRML